MNRYRSTLDLCTVGPTVTAQCLLWQEIKEGCNIDITAEEPRYENNVSVYIAAKLWPRVCGYIYAGYSREIKNKNVNVVYVCNSKGRKLKCGWD